MLIAIHFPALVEIYWVLLCDAAVLLAESCLRQHPDATVLHVHRCMADYLKLAPYRLGGAGKGCHHPHFETMLEESVAGNSHNTAADANIAGDDDGEGTKNKDTVAEDTDGDGMESSHDADGEGTEDEVSVTEDEDTDGEGMEGDDGDVDGEVMEDDGTEGDDYDQGDDDNDVEGDEVNSTLLLLVSSRIPWGIRQRSDYQWVSFGAFACSMDPENYICRKFGRQGRGQWMDRWTLHYLPHRRSR